jgi:hypothetical protein
VHPRTAEQIADKDVERNQDEPNQDELDERTHVICRKCGAETFVGHTRYPEVAGKLNKRAKRRLRICSDKRCGFRESTLEVPEHRVILDQDPKARKRA